MSKHLQITTNGKPLNLGNDLSIDISFENPMFNDAQAFSYPVRIPLEGNRHLVKNIDDKRSALRPVSLEDTFTRIHTDGFPFFSGKLKTSDSEEVTDSISLNVDGDKNFKSLIQDLKCQDIPVKDEIKIGECISKLKTSGTFNVTYEASFSVGNEILQLTRDVSEEVEFNTQALGFSVPYKCTQNIEEKANIKSKTNTGVDGYEECKPKIIENYINVDTPYGENKVISETSSRPAYYCNSRVTYKHHPLNSDGTTDTESVSEGNPYFVLDADRPQSGICFYVLYFLDCLFAHLGLDWDNSALTSIEDMKRLCFYTTKCDYYTKSEKVSSMSLSSINDWLSSRGCGSALSLSGPRISDDIMYFKAEKNTPIIWADTIVGHSYNYILVEDVTFKHGGYVQYIKLRKADSDYIWTTPIRIMNYYVRLNNYSLSDYEVEFSSMYANSGNFPDTSVIDIIESLENQFGIRFIYDQETKKVTAQLLRDIYRQSSTPKPFLGTVLEMNKLSEKILGVRIGYSAESDSKDQYRNVRQNTRDYDTEFDYIDYPDPANGMGIAGIARARYTDTTKSYLELPQPTNVDNTCYIDQQTGNAYRVKIDSEASSEKEMHPVRFEVGAFKSVEFGDCSAINENNITELLTSFEPVRLSCTNPKEVEIGLNPLMVPYCDEDMEHEYVKQILQYPFSNNVISARIEANLHLRENYDTSSSDDGNSPLQSYDWGTAIAIMRGGGSDATLQEYSPNYDGFGSSKWRTVPGIYALTTDSIDHLGNEYDYNANNTDGSPNGIGSGERFSLKPRGYKQPEWANAPLCRADYHDSEGWHFIRTRGWADRFLYEHANFLINRRKFIVRAQCEAAFVADIPNHWQDKWLINGEIGYINKVSTSISVQDGIGETEIEFYAI